MLRYGIIVEYGLDFVDIKRAIGRGADKGKTRWGSSRKVLVAIKR